MGAGWIIIIHVECKYKNTTYFGASCLIKVNLGTLAVRVNALYSISGKLLCLIRRNLIGLLSPEMENRKVYPFFTQDTVRSRCYCSIESLNFLHAYK